jgi:predicted aminopeptidase
MVPRPVAALTIAALLLPALTSCYTTRVLSGGAGILSRRKPIEKVLAAGDLPPEQQRQLELTQSLREFAIVELGLPDNGSYTTFVQVDGSYVTWNVVAAPELSVEPLTWCFPIAGCVSYRGYFKEKRARKFAAGLERKGNDVRVGGVDAYSTLGKFKDPVLSTFLGRRDTDLAGLLFHEMAHQRLYVKGDTAFNESFATVVELEAVRRWLAAEGRDEEIAEVEQSQELERKFTDLLLEFREELVTAFEDDVSDEAKRQRKRELYDQLPSIYEEAKRDWGGDDRYDRWFSRPLNNAHLAAVSNYHIWVEPLTELLRRSGGSMEEFYSRAEELGELDAETRRERLESLVGPGGGRITGVQSDQERK